MIESNDLFIIIVNRIFSFSVKIYNEENKISLLDVSFTYFGSFNQKMFFGFAI